METLLVIITALVLVAALVWFCRRRIIQCPRHVIINRALLDEVKPQIKPGDLLLFSSYRYNFFTRTFGNAVFAHTGVVVEHNGALCAYEMVENDYTVLGADPSRDILITPLEDRIRNYPGNVFIASLKVPLTPAQRERLDEFVATRRYTFTKRWKLLALIPTRILLDRERFCSEFTASVLDYVGIAHDPIRQRKLNHTAPSCGCAARTCTTTLCTSSCATLCATCGTRTTCTSLRTAIRSRRIEERYVFADTYMQNQPLELVDTRTHEHGELVGVRDYGRVEREGGHRQRASDVAQLIGLNSLPAHYRPN